MKPACLWTVVSVEFVHTGSVCVHAGGPTVVVSVWKELESYWGDVL